MGPWRSSQRALARGSAAVLAPVTVPPITGTPTAVPVSVARSHPTTPVTTTIYKICTNLHVLLRAYRTLICRAGRLSSLCDDAVG
jgi:hypothetical protein